jgi:tRNA G18 (ribose-2'-O)-methylase SpoU
MVAPIDWAATIADAAALKRDGLFLVEGRLVLERLLSSMPDGAARVVAVLATAAAARALDLEARLPDRLDVRTPAEMAALTGFNFHRGVLALVERPPTRSVDALLDTVGPGRRRHPRDDGGASDADGRRPHDEGRPVFVVLEHLVDADNVGSCFRNARAFGAAGVLLDDRCVDPLYRKAVRTSMGAVLDTPWTVAPVGTIVETLHRRGVTTVALTPHAGATPLHALTGSVNAQTPLALVVGNEGAGLSPETLARCTHRAAIQMAPGADSLNVATALAVGLYEMW